MRFSLIIGLTAALLSLSPAARAQRLRMTMDDPNFKPFPIAVTDLVDEKSGSALTGGISAEIVTALRNDLDFSQAFMVLSPKSFIASAQEPWTAPKFADWVNIGASGLVRGALTLSGGEANVTFRFYDVVGGREALKRTYTTRPENARTVAHLFADELIKLLTGEDGVFSTKIAFALRTEETNIYVMDFDGQNLHKLSKGSKINLLPTWDRAGREIFYTSYLNNNPDLYAVDIAGGQARPVSAQRGLNTGAAVSPDGTKVALTLSKDGNSEIYIMNRDGTGLKRLTENWWIDTSPSWSPDGKQIAYVSTKTGNPHIYTMNADGSNQQRITFQGNYNQTPDWSPRGNVIAFTARDERFHFDIFTVDPKSHEIKRLTQDQGNNEEPAYSPDGRLMAFVSNRGGEKKVWVMNADGSKPRVIYNGRGECETPAWGPRAK